MSAAGNTSAADTARLNRGAAFASISVALFLVLLLALLFKPYGLFDREVRRV